MTSVKWGLFFMREPCVEFVQSGNDVFRFVQTKPFDTAVVTEVLTKGTQQSLIAQAVFMREPE